MHTQNTCAQERERLKQAVHTALIQGDFSAALHEATEAARRYEAARDAEGEALTLCLRGKCYRRLNDLPAALQALEQSRDCYQTLNDRLGVADVLQAKSGVLRLMGRDDEAIGDLQESGAIYKNANERAQQMRVQMNLSVFYKQKGDLATAQELLYDCLAFFEQGDQTTQENQSDMAKVLLNIATNYSVLEKPAETVRFARRGIPLFEAMGDPHSLSMAHCVLGAGYMKQSDDLNAMKEFRASLKIAERVGIPWVISLVLDDIGSILMRQKRFDEARQVLEQCVRTSAEGGNRLVHGGNLQRLGSLLAHPDYAERDVEKAFVYLREARQIAEAQDAGIILGAIYESLTLLHEEKGDYKEALKTFRAFHAVDKRLFNEASDNRVKALEIEKAQKDAEIAQLRTAQLTQALEDTERLRILADEWARSDALTGLFNRRAFDECLDEAWERSLLEARPLCVALMDIDHFKKINDTWGHGTGDEALRQTAQILRGLCRSGDVIARYGGEEFALLLPRTSKGAARAFCEQMREAVANFDWALVHPQLTPITISIGIHAMEENPREKLTDPAALLAAADRNLYHAKHGGRNRVVS